MSLSRVAAIRSNAVPGEESIKEGASLTLVIAASFRETNFAVGGLHRMVRPATHEHVSKKVLDFFDQDMLQLFDFEQFQ